MVGKYVWIIFHINCRISHDFFFKDVFFGIELCSYVEATNSLYHNEELKVFVNDCEKTGTLACYNFMGVRRRGDS